MTFPASLLEVFLGVRLAPTVFGAALTRGGVEVSGRVTVDLRWDDKNEASGDAHFGPYPEPVEFDGLRLWGDGLVVDDVTVEDAPVRLPAGWSHVHTLRLVVTGG